MSKRAVLHFVNGETFSLSKQASKVLYESRHQESLMGRNLIHDGDYSLSLFNVIKIEWLSEQQYMMKYVKQID